MKPCLLFLVLFTLAGCNQKFDDVSSSKEFSRIINKEYHTNEDFEILSISTEKNEKIDFYIIDVNKKVKHISPEVLSRRVIPKGSVIKIERIHKCNNCFFFSLIKFSVRVIDGKVLPHRPIYLSFELKEDVERKELTRLVESIELHGTPSASR
jgi:hypothetical protein